MIVFQDVLRRYVLGGESWTLGPVSLTIPEGQRIAILGSSGSGKSTLLHLLGALDTPTEGEIIVTGQKLSEMSEKEKDAYRKKMVGFVFQDFHLFPQCTVQENISFPLRLQGVSGDIQEEKIQEILSSVGLKGYEHHFPRELSGGQRQRVAIARALVHEPPIVLADEPTGNLDEKTGGQIIALLEDLAEKKGTTMILVTHDERLAKRCDAIIRIENGKLMEG